MNKRKLRVGMFLMIVMMLLTASSVHAECSHKYGNWKVQSKATVKKEGKIARVCGECGFIQTKNVKWTFAGSRSEDPKIARRYKCYELTVYEICVGNKYVLIETDEGNVETGAVIKLNVGKKKYSYTIKTKSKNWLYKIPITNAKAYEKITASLYYNGKKIGIDQYHTGNEVDKSLYHPTVLVAKKPLKGMTKKQVENTYLIYGEKLEILSTAEGGYEYCRTKRYSFVFKNGKLESYMKR